MNDNFFKKTIPLEIHHKKRPDLSRILDYWSTNNLFIILERRIKAYYTKRRVGSQAELVKNKTKIIIIIPKHTFK